MWTSIALRPCWHRGVNCKTFTHFFFIGWTRSHVMKNGGNVLTCDTGRVKCLSFEYLKIRRHRWWRMMINQRPRYQSGTMFVPGRTDFLDSAVLQVEHWEAINANKNFIIKNSQTVGCTVNLVTKTKYLYWSSLI